MQVSNLSFRWAALIASGALAFGPVTVRTQLDADDTAITGYYLRDETRRISGKHARFLADFSAAVTSGDAVTVDTAIAIVTQTPEAREVDTIVYRNATEPGCLLLNDAGDILRTGVLDIPADAPGVEVAPIELVICNLDEGRDIRMDPVRRLEILPASAPAEIAGFLETYEDETRARLICDIHEGAHRRSVTITRQADTAEGPVRSVIYSEMEA